MEINQTLELIGDDTHITNVLNEIKTDDLLIDFNKIVPTPEELMITPFIDVIVAFQAYDNPPEDFTPERVEMFNQMRSNLSKYGYTDYRGWRSVNWGYLENPIKTKKGVKENSINFTTKNAPALIVVRALSIKYPLIKFKLTYQEQSFTFKNGNIVSTKK